MHKKIESSKSSVDKARAALSKRASLGEDIDLEKYTKSADELPYQNDPSQLPGETKEQMIQEIGRTHVGTPVTC